MTINIRCPKCQTENVAPDQAVGRKVRCAGCGFGIAVPLPGVGGAATPPLNELAAAVQAPEEQPEAGAAVPMPERPSRSAISATTTTIRQFIGRGTYYRLLRVLGGAIFVMGVSLAALFVTGGIVALVLLSMQGYGPWLAIGIFIGALIVAGVLVVATRAISEVLRLLADVGDLTRQNVRMLEEMTQNLEKQP